MTLTEFFDTDPTWPQDDTYITCKGIRTCLNSVDYFRRQREPFVMYYVFHPNSPYNASYTNDKGDVVEFLNIPEDKMLKLATQVRDALAEKHFWQKQEVCINLRTMQVVEN